MKLADTRAVISGGVSGLGLATAVRIVAAGGQVVLLDIDQAHAAVESIPPREVEDGLIKNIPKKYMTHAHHWLILHGRYICTARAPKCAACPIFKWCQWEDKEKRRQEQLQA